MFVYLDGHPFHPHHHNRLLLAPSTPYIPTSVTHHFCCIWIHSLVLFARWIKWLPDMANCSIVISFTTWTTIIICNPTGMPRPKCRPYSLFTPPSLSSSELICTTLDHDSTDMLIDKWLEHRSSGHDAYHDWFRELRTRRHAAQNPIKKQVIAWNKGDFVPENVFCRTVDTGRLIPLDRTWTTHVYHHKTMSERKLSMMPVVFTMVGLLSATDVLLGARW